MLLKVPHPGGGRGGVYKLFFSADVIKEHSLKTLNLFQFRLTGKSPMIKTEFLSTSKIHETLQNYFRFVHLATVYQFFIDPHFVAREISQNNKVICIFLRPARITGIWLFSSDGSATSFMTYRRRSKPFHLSILRRWLNDFLFINEEVTAKIPFHKFS